jgi:hypothetical protein
MLAAVAADTMLVLEQPRALVASAAEVLLEQIVMVLLQEPILAAEAVAALV